VRVSERYSLAIKDLPPEERPRERLAKHGPEALSTPELLAILLRTGTARESALDVAEGIVSAVGGLRGLADVTIEQLSQIRGVGVVKAIEIRAAVELGKRISAFTHSARPVIRCPADVCQLVMSELRHETREHFKVLLLDTRNQVTRVNTVSVGTLTESIVHPREVFREAIRHSAAALIAVHNHPSGDPTPSPEDIQVTKRLDEAGRLVGIDLLDHVIVGDGRYISLKEKGLF
jgi:DNA repair protein RadC